MTLQLDVYRPVGDAVAQRPLVVFVHGGGFSGGSRTSPEIVDEANTLARQGYVTASISYRLTPGGCSAGGPTASASPPWSTPRRTRRPPSRTSDPRRRPTGSTRPGSPSPGRRPAPSPPPTWPSAAPDAPDDRGAGGGVALGRPPHVRAQRRRRAPAPPPRHGDGLVPYAWAQNTVTAATNAGVRAVLTTWEGGGHVPYAAHRTEILDQTRNFLYWHMDLANAAR